MYRAVLAASYAVSGALFCVVADFGADGRERVIAEEYFSGFHEFVLLEELDDLRNWSVYRTSFLTHGFFAVQAAFSFGNYVQRHRVLSPLKVSV